jgi:ABC-type branched-subunit amino acid transport system substrate-binding protein
VGQQIHDAARLALRDASHESRGGVQLLLQDDRGDPDRAARLAGYLVRLPEVVAVIGPGEPETAARALPALSQAGGLPTLMPISLDAALVRDNDHVFGLAPSAESLGETLAWFLVSELSIDSAATLVAGDSFGQSLERGFARELGRLGGGTGTRAAIEPAGGVPDPLPEAVSSARAVLISARPERGSQRIAALRRSGFSGAILVAAFPDTSGAGAVVDSLGAVYYPLIFNPTADYVARGFAERFQDSYGRQPGEPAALAYDGLNLVLEALGAGATDRRSVLTWLQEMRPSTALVGISGHFFFSRERLAVRDLAVASLGSRGPVAKRAGAQPGPTVAPR